MFDIQENHVRMIVIVEVIASMTDVFELVKTKLTAHLEINV